MKRIVNWRIALLFFLIAGGLLVITESFWISLGILLLLLIVDRLLAMRDEKGKRQSVDKSSKEK